MHRWIATALLATILLPVAVSAKNVDLVTLPKRDSVQLTIYNSADLTLVKEVRAITLRKGANRLQFSWAGTLIDPTSVELRALQHADQIEVADTTFPGQKPQHLIWNIQSEFEGEALVEVSYFTSGLTWSMDYVAIADPVEERLSLKGHVRVFNNSGEEYENAEVRLIVGKINLVEKIADLARTQNTPMPGEKTRRYKQLERDAVSIAFADAAVDMDDGYLMLGQKVSKGAKNVAKEGVGEYFMFSVEGSETISNGWSKRMPAINAKDVAFDIVYRLRTYQYGPRPVRFFVWRNDKEHSLGDSPLPDGVVRVFRHNGQEGLSFLGQQPLKYVPIQAEIEVNLGADDLVVFEQLKTSTKRRNFSFNNDDAVTGWDEVQQWQGVIRNYREKPIDFELRLQWAGDVEVEAPKSSSAFDFKTVEMKLNSRQRNNRLVPYSTTIHHGSNAKQNRVKLRTRG